MSVPDHDSLEEDSAEDGPKAAADSGSSLERTLEVPQGTFELVRHPLRSRSTLRAWDAADAYALRFLAERGLVGPIGLVNDGFGALAASLHHFDPVVVTDSAMSEIGIGDNLQRNGLTPVTVDPEIEALPNELGAVVFKVPKSLGQLEEQLHQLRPKLTSDTLILGAGMVRQIHTSTLELLQSIIGPTSTSLAERKARLIHCTLDPDLAIPPNPWPLTWHHGGRTICNRGGVFSASSIDIGTRLLLEHLPNQNPSGEQADGPMRLVDLGCGNGVLGTTAADTGTGTDTDVIFVDSSARAVDSARQTWRANFGDRRAEFHRTDRMVNVLESGSADLVLNNPPFHDERAVGNATAWDMFVDSFTVLRSGGEIRVVANRQLGHHARLRKIFGNCETVASNRKFVVLSAKKRR